MSAKTATTTTYQCYINPDWKETGLARVTIARQSGKKIVSTVFLVDIFCLGVKDAMRNESRSWKSFEMMELPMMYFDTRPEPISFQLARDIVCGAVKYAQSLGFDPHPDFFQFGRFLDWETCVPDADIRFGGPNGKPLYVVGPHDSVDDVVRTLESKVGEDGFEVVYPYEEQ